MTKARNFNMLKKGDILLAAVVLLAVFAVIAGMKVYSGSGGNSHKIAVIKQDNKIVGKIDLDAVKAPERIKLSGSYNETILVEKGRIRFEEADCPDKICVKTGWLSQKGDMAVCLPNKAIVKIEGESDKVDIVTF